MSAGAPAEPKGKVYLVGAGPGDPKLLTLRAHELLQSADVIAHDDLVAPEILACVAPRAELLSVGRRGGSGRSPYRLHPQVLALARSGKQVVRLKGGDPMVFGRGGEETRQLAEAGIPFEIVPGISTALGAAAYAGIPLTHRDLSSSVMLTTGHFAEEGNRHEGTVVLYMASHNLAENLRRLIAAGRAPHTPAAYIASATRPSQQVIVGTLQDLAGKASGLAAAGDPAIVIVGEVVRARAWSEWRPASSSGLSGRRILVARARPVPSELAVRLRDLGAQVSETPLVRAQQPNSYDSFDRAVQMLERGAYGTVILESPAGVDGALARLGQLGKDLRDLPRIPWIALGAQAARRLRDHGLQPQATTEGSCRKALESLGARATRKRLLVIGSEQGRPSLVEDLRSIGWETETAAVYAHRHQFPKLVPPYPDLVILPSSSAARLALAEPSYAPLLRIPALAIGPKTEEAARNLGARRVHRASDDTIEAVIDAAGTLLSSAPRPSDPKQAGAAS
jgi:uroporphyrinogen III methyltransferase/synthase